MPVEMLNPHHERHPASTGERACRAFAWLDLVAIARWRKSGGLERGELRASVRFLANRWNWSKDRTERFLSDLEEDGEITRETQPGRKPGHITICNYNDYDVPRDKRKDASQDANKDANEDKVHHTPCTNSITSAEQEVFDYWVEQRDRVMGKNGGPAMRPIGKRVSKIRARLGEGYSPAQLKDAVLGCLSNPFNVERGYTDIELICRNQAKVEQYIAWRAANREDADPELFSDLQRCE